MAEAEAIEINSTEPQAISQERNREVQTILNVLKAPSNSELGRKRKVSSNQGGKSTRHKRKPTDYEPNVCA